MVLYYKFHDGFHTLHTEGINSVEYNVCAFEFPKVGMEGEVAFAINIAI